MKLKQKNMHMLMYVSALFIAMVFIACPTESLRNNADKGNSNPKTVELVANATKAAITAGEAVEKSAQALLTISVADKVALKTQAQKLHDDAKTMRDKAQDVRDGAEKLVEDIKAQEKSGSSDSVSAFVFSSISDAPVKRSAKLKAAEKGLEIAEAALRTAEQTVKDTQAVLDDAEKGSLNTTKIYAVIKSIKETKATAQQVQKINKDIQTIETSKETILLVGRGFEIDSDGGYKATIEEGDVGNFELEDIGVGIKELKAQYDSGTGAKKAAGFVITKKNSNRTLVLSPGQDSNAPTGGTYVFIVSKDKTSENTKAANITVTIEITKKLIEKQQPSDNSQNNQPKVDGKPNTQVKQETIVFKEENHTMKEGLNTPIVVTDSGVGDGRLEVRLINGKQNKFAFLIDGKTITFTPNSGENTPARGQYSYLVEKTPTENNLKADPVVIGIDVLGKPIELKLNKSSAEMKEGAIQPIVVQDIGHPQSKLTATFMLVASKGGSDGKFSIDGNTAGQITFTPNSGQDKPTEGMYVFTINKQVGDDNQRSIQTPFAITVTSDTDVVKQETIVLNKLDIKTMATSSLNNPSIAGNVPLVLQDSGVGNGTLSLKSVVKVGDASSANLKDKFQIHHVGGNLGIIANPQNKLEVGDYRFTISKAVTGKNTPAQDVTITVKVTANQGGLFPDGALPDGLQPPHLPGGGN